MKKILMFLLVSALLAGCALAEDALCYDFSRQAQTYLEYIGKNLVNRSAWVEGQDAGENNAHDAARDWIISEMKAAGYGDDQITCEEMKISTWYGMDCSVANIVLTVEGSDPSRQIIVGAHYDGNGLGDNGSGVALMLSTICGLADKQPLHTVKYVFFDAEEAGLVGASLYAQSMSEEEIASTLFMLNIDSLAFGDYCNLYGGYQDPETGKVSQLEPYELAVQKARKLGMKVYTAGELDGYYAEHGEGPAIEDFALYTNPWTKEHPAPINQGSVSPTTIDASDHVDFKYMGIPYIYMEATNWFAAGDGGFLAYTGYFETDDTSLGESGMFMNTRHDTLENLNTLFPGRSLAHYRVYSPLLGELIMNPVSVEP